MKDPNPPTLSQAFDLALQFHRAGRLDEATDAYRRALQMKPDFPEALNNLGAILRTRGRLDEAIAACRRALELEPKYREARLNLGAALAEQGRIGEAIVHFRRALDLKPDDPLALNNLGAALIDQGQFADAVALCRRALQLRPDYPEALNNLGNALAGDGELDEAMGAYRGALKLRPDYTQAHNNLGNALRLRGRLAEAISACHRALQLHPHYPEALNNLGNALTDCGELEKAVTAYRRALQIKPDYLEPHINLGAAFTRQGQFDNAVAAVQRAIELRPDHPKAHTNLGNALMDQGRLDDAIAAYRRAIHIMPQDAIAQSNLIYALHHHPGYKHGMISKEHDRWNLQFSAPVKPFILPHANRRDPDRRLRIGYVSPDFRDHPVGRQALPLFERHDRGRFDILCYSEAARPDAMTERLRAEAGKWRDTVGVPDARLAELIREDEVDILVDLAQHTAGNRLAMFARKPAPVQVSFAGYPESAGVEAIEYRISDRFLEEGPAKEGMRRMEHLSFMDSFWCFDPRGLNVEVNALPALKHGTATFGSLGKLSKMNEPMLKLWARVLGAVKESRLILLSEAGSHRQWASEILERQGLDAGRVEFVEPCRRSEYLELYHRLDIVLDTFPYNGHTTSLDALWMGVPVVSLAGETPVSRGGLSILTNVGLPELAAHSEEDYANIAGSLAANLPRLTELRATLRQRMRCSPLMDAPRFAQNVEAAYRSMWKRWCENPSPLSD